MGPLPKCQIHTPVDNDLRFDTQPGHILAIELRDGTNHYNPEFDETLIGAGQALRFSGRVLFAEDETPAPAGSFTISLGDYDNEWTTTSREGGYFSIDLLVPDVRSGHLDLRAKLVDLPALFLGLSNINIKYVPSGTNSALIICGAGLL